MFFRKKRQKEAKETENAHPVYEQKGPMQESAPAEKKKELTIAAVEQALQKAENPEDKILLLKVAGDAYASGDIGAVQSYDKAIEYYQAAADLGSLECLHSVGTTYISAYWGVDQMLFSIGVAKVCDSYKKGYASARDTLQYLVDSDVFPNCKSVEDLLSLSEVV